MQNQLQMFTNSEFGEIEVFVLNGKPYFRATECAKALGYAQPEKAIRMHCKGVSKIDTPSNGGMQKANFITEGDLYRLIAHSKLPSALRFESFIFDQVLPSIRKYGAYLTDEAICDVINHPDFTFQVLQAMIDKRKKNEALQAELAVAAPKAKYCDEILKSEKAIQLSIIAKDYGLSTVSFNKLLHVLGIQYKMGDTWLLYQDYADKGYTKTKTFRATSKKVVIHTYWTHSGRMFLYNVLRQNGILPLIETKTNHAGI